MKILLLAGTTWDGVPGAARQIAPELSRHADLIWIDPPLSLTRYMSARRNGKKPAFGLVSASRSLHRLIVLAPPASTRPIIRSATQLMHRAAIRRNSKDNTGTAPVTIIATPESSFPISRSTKILYVTDNWESGAAMMGLSERRVRRILRENIERADIICAVSPELLASLQRHGRDDQHFALVPNGCAVETDIIAQRPAEIPNAPFAILAGNINERLDLDLLQALADSGIELVVVGPRTERDQRVAKRYDALFAQPNIRWLGPRTRETLRAYLRFANIGLTPYSVSDFNRDSFPLKTLEYLAAGIPAVTTDLPSSHWLNTPFVDIATTAEDFVATTQMWLRRGTTQTEKAKRQAFAASHGWNSRADIILRLIQLANSRHEAKS